MMLGVSDADATVSLVAQLTSMVAAAVLGRLCLKTRGWIWIVALLGAVGAMFAHIAVDGQGAFLLLIYAPVIYFVATVGRGDLNAAPRR
jgi:hypothetical protein